MSGFVSVPELFLSHHCKSMCQVSFSFVPGLARLPLERVPSRRTLRPQRGFQQTRLYAILLISPLVFVQIPQMSPLPSIQASSTPRFHQLFPLLANQYFQSFQA